MSIKFLVLGFFVFVFVGGGGVPIYFYGREDFSENYSTFQKLTYIETSN